MWIGELNFSRFLDWHVPFTRENARQAAYAFKGDVYLGLDIGSFRPADLDFAQQHLRILSGLYGVLRPLDLIQPYRLEMGTRLATCSLLAAGMLCAHYASADTIFTVSAIPSGATVPSLSARRIS